MSDCKKIILFSFLLAIFFSFSVYAQGPSPNTADFRGFVRINSSIAVNGTPVSAVINNGSAWVANTSVYTVEAGSGFYQLNVPGDTGDKINFKVCGVNVTLDSLSWALGPYRNGTYPYINLSVSTSANGVACTYACGCTGGFCNSGLCAASATTTTTPPTATTSPPGGGGPGGAIGTTTTAVGATTTTSPPVLESETVATIANGTTGNFSFQTVPVTDLLVDVNNTVSNVQVSITKTDAAPATVAIGAPGYTYAYLTIVKTNIADKDVSNVKIKFKVEKSWIVENSIDVSSIALYRYVDGNWVPLPTAKLSEDSSFVYFEATSPGLSVFVVSAQKKIVTTSTTAAPTATTVKPTTTTAPITPPVVPPTILFIVIGIVLIFVIVIFFIRRGRKSVKVPDLFSKTT